MKQALVTVIIPTYNRGHVVENAIRSVLAQTYEHWHLVVIDDGSVDDTRARVAAFCQAHPTKIEYYYQPNRGQASARNHGLRHCRGEYVASLDSDDEWYADFLATSVAQLTKRSLDLVFLNWVGTYDTAGFAYFYEMPARRRAYCTTLVDEQWWLLNPAQIRQLAIETCPSPSSSLVMRRSIMTTGWNEQMRIADDWCLLLDAVLNQPCQAAFTLKAHWLKHTHDSNIFDGRSDTTMIRNLGLHDEPLMVQRFKHLLNQREKQVFRQRIAAHYFNFLCLNRANDPSLASTVHHTAKALYLFPLTISRKLLERGLERLKRQLPAT